MFMLCIDFLFRLFTLFRRKQSRSCPKNRSSPNLRDVFVMLVKNAFTHVTSKGKNLIILRTEKAFKVK